MSTLQMKRSLTAVAVAAAFAGGAIVADHYGAASAAHAAIPVASPSAATAATTAPVAALPDFADMVAKHGPAVVEVSTQKLAHRTRQQVPDLDGLPPWFRQFAIPDMPDQHQGPMRGLGSGFVVDPNGIILTNAHVVDGADEVTVKFTNQHEYTAKVLGVDKATDIAVLKIDAKDLPTVTIGDSSKARVGEWVVAIGAPFGLENTVTSGIISAKSRSLPGDSIVPFIQTDAAVNPGNSGGPLFDLQGRVIGINSQIYSRSGGFMGVSFSIPIDVALKVSNQLETTGHVSRGKLGVVIQDVNQGLADSFGLPQPEGALVSSVEKGGPAAQAGIEPGDVILKLNGQTVGRSTELPVEIAEQSPGATVNLEVWRSHSSRNLSVKLGAMEDKRTAANTNMHEGAGGKLGLAVRPLTPQEKSQANTQQGVLVEKAAGPAAQAGLQPGDVVLAANGAPITSVEDLRNAVEKSKGHIALLVQRGDSRIFVPVRVGG